MGSKPILKNSNPEIEEIEEIEEKKKKPIRASSIFLPNRSDFYCEGTVTPNWGNFKDRKGIRDPGTPIFNSLKIAKLGATQNGASAQAQLRIREHPDGRRAGRAEGRMLSRYSQQRRVQSGLFHGEEIAKACEMVVCLGGYFYPDACNCILA